MSRRSRLVHRLYHYSRRNLQFDSPRPAWWPENEPWPPLRRPIRYPFFRRIGCAFGIFSMFSLVLFVVGVLLVSRGSGLANPPFDSGKILILTGLGFAFLIILILTMGGTNLHHIILSLDDLLKAADRVGEGDYSTQVQEKGPREVRRLARAFNDMASRLRQINEQRRDLLADVTHELNTPLTVIQGNLEGMLDGIYPADEANLRTLLEETNHLSGLVGDLRTLALTESGALRLKKEPTDLALLVRETAASFQTRATTAGVTLTVETGNDYPWLELDPGRVRQVLTNLLANALRYTPSGGMISVRYRQADGRALLEVQDSGPGISKDELPHVFERYYKSTDSGGMGLGLAIARNLVEAHGGTIIAESPPGSGTIMRITLLLGEEK
jgi:two-component system, OmpR family, sensor histidine kinase BaeS